MKTILLSFMALAFMAVAMLFVGTQDSEWQYVGEEASCVDASGIDAVGSCAEVLAEDSKPCFQRESRVAYFDEVIKDSNIDTGANASIEMPRCAFWTSKGYLNGKDRSHIYGDQAFNVESVELFDAAARQSQGQVLLCFYGLA